MKKFILFVIRFYQLFVSSNLGRNCRFYPSCSEYTRQAILKYGVLTGYWKGFKRITRCHPLNRGGIDFP